MDSIEPGGLCAQFKAENAHHLATGRPKSKATATSDHVQTDHLPILLMLLLLLLLLLSDYVSLAKKS